MVCIPQSTMGCCCECRAPKRLRYVPPAVVAFLIVWQYGAFVWFAQPQLLARKVGLLELTAFHVMTLLLCASLGQCLLSNDSFVVRRKRRDEPPPPPTDDGSEVAVETKANGARRFCRRCNVWKADRMHHCSSCRRCVLKMDHHCVYINKCIGYYNYKFFLQFLGWSSTTCLYFSSLIFRYLLLDHFDYATALFFHGRLHFWSPSLQIVLVFFLGACLGAALLCFYLLHAVLLAFNYTTLEYCEKRRDGDDYINYFNLGVVGNFQQVLGTFRELPYWFLPLATPSVVHRGGTTFPVNAKFVKEE